MQLDAGRIRRRVYGILRTRVNDEWPSILSDFKQQSLSNAFKLKLQHNVNLFLVEMKAATGREIAEHVMKPAKVIPATLFKECYAHC